MQPPELGRIGGPGNHRYYTVHGTIYSQYREFHREQGIRGKKQRRIARGGTDKLKGPRGGRIRKQQQQQEAL